MKKRILLLGSGSFAAQGLEEMLRAAGHEVYTFHRGSLGRDGFRISGDVLDLCRNDKLKMPFDTVINYVILKGEGTVTNGSYIDELLHFCQACRAEKLIHISSVSVYRESVRHVVEDAEFETDPGRKGSYGAVKVIQDIHLQQRKKGMLQVVYIRPGFILGQGLADPVVGMALRIGGGLLQLGSGRNVVPVIPRRLLNETVVKAVGKYFHSPDQVIMAVDKNSPDRREWLNACCKEGLGRFTVSLPAWFWKLAGWGAEIPVRLLRKPVKPRQLVANMLREMIYDASASEELMQVNFSCDWNDELRYALQHSSE